MTLSGKRRDWLRMGPTNSDRSTASCSAKTATHTTHRNHRCNRRRSKNHYQPSTSTVPRHATNPLPPPPPPLHFPSTASPPAKRNPGRGNGWEGAAHHHHVSEIGCDRKREECMREVAGATSPANSGAKIWR